MFERCVSESPVLAPVLPTARRWLQLIRAEQLRHAYARMLPLVHRFLIAELDCSAPSWRGIGRWCDADPPARFGSRYRRQLEEPGAREKVGLAAEREALMGFLLSAVWRGEPPGAPALEELWDAVVAWLAVMPEMEPGTSELFERRIEPLAILRLQLARITSEPMSEVCGEVEIAELGDPPSDLDFERFVQAQEVAQMPIRFGRGLYEQSIGPRAGRLAPAMQALLEDYTEQRSTEQLRELVRMARRPGSAAP